MEELIQLIKNAFQYIKNLIRKIVDGILNFAKHVVGWFKSLNLIQGQDIPFLANKEQFKETLKKAPVKHAGIFTTETEKNVGIIQGVYNEVTDEITHAEYIEADGLDNQTRDILGNEKLVVLN
jgi:hypothetical protein